MSIQNSFLGSFQESGFNFYIDIPNYFPECVDEHKNRRNCQVILKFDEIPEGYTLIQYLMYVYENSNLEMKIFNQSLTLSQKTIQASLNIDIGMVLFKNLYYKNSHREYKTNKLKKRSKIPLDSTNLNLKNHRNNLYLLEQRRAELENEPKPIENRIRTEEIKRDLEIIYNKLNEDFNFQQGLESKSQLIKHHLKSPKFNSLENESAIQITEENRYKEAHLSRFEDWGIQGEEQLHPELEFKN